MSPDYTHTLYVSENIKKNKEIKRKKELVLLTSRDRLVIRIYIIIETPKEMKEIRGRDGY